MLDRLAVRADVKNAWNKNKEKNKRQKIITITNHQSMILNPPPLTKKISLQILMNQIILPRILIIPLLRLTVMIREREREREQATRGENLPLPSNQNNLQPEVRKADHTPIYLVSGVVGIIIVAVGISLVIAAKKKRKNGRRYQK